MAVSNKLGDSNQSISYDDYGNRKVGYNFDQDNTVYTSSYKNVKTLRLRDLESPRANSPNTIVEHRTSYVQPPKIQVYTKREDMSS